MGKEAKVKTDVILQVLICTCGETGLEKVAAMTLPQAAGIGYLVSIQAKTMPPVPESIATREDLAIFHTCTHGLSLNRNHAIAHSTAPLCLIADDDLHYNAGGLQAVIDTFSKHPEIDIAAFSHTGGDNKYFPSYGFDMSLPPKGYYLTSFEIAFRRSSVTGCGIRFNEFFGLGCDRFGSGEEDIWMADCLRSGLKARFFPVDIVTHPGRTTGTSRQGTESVLRAQGAVIAYTYGASSLPRTILKAFRASHSSGTSLLKCARAAIEGWLTAKFKPGSIGLKRLPQCQ